MNDPDEIMLEVDGKRIYAPRFDDLAGVILALRADLSITIGQQHSALQNLEQRVKQLSADLIAQREVQVYGPELTAAHAEALEARDRSLEENEQLRQQLERLQQAFNDADKTRRALGAQVRSLKQANEHLAGQVLEYSKALEAAKKKRRAKP